MANVIKNHYSFPTLISEFRYDIPEEMKQCILNQDYNVSDVFPFFTNQTTNTRLDKFKEFQGFVTKILDTTKELCEMYNYKYKKLEITNLWVNVSKKGSAHNPHTHSNNIFSGVWFPFENVSNTPIIFLDPRPANGVMQPYIETPNEYNATMKAFQPNESVGLIFPSWLMHYVQPSNGKRISISWNILLRGEYGSPTHLQNAHI